VARDRKRARQRRERGGPGSARRAPGSGGTPREDHLHREDVPGEVEHASSPADEFDAALVRGAEGVPVPDDAADSAEAADELQVPARAAPAGGTLRESASASARPAAEQPSGAPLRGGNRVAGFLAASWAELQRVQWPDRRQVTQATAVVLGFVAVAGVYLGVADFVAKEIVEFIL
jgi:preprotein translocase SecE subunit